MMQTRVTQQHDDRELHPSESRVKIMELWAFHQAPRAANCTDGARDLHERLSLLISVEFRANTGKFNVCRCTLLVITSMRSRAQSHRTAPEVTFASSNAVAADLSSTRSTLVKNLNLASPSFEKVRRMAALQERKI